MTNDEILNIELKPISKTQGKIFKYVAQKSEVWDFCAFVNNYMTSEFCNITMDAKYSYEQLSPVSELLDDIEPLIPKPNPHCEKISPESAYWIGFMYRYYSRKYNISSRNLVKKISPETMLNIESEQYRDGDVSDFEKRMCELCGT